MSELIESLWMYVKELGETHNVNPILFGILYVGSIPPYVASMGWIVRNYRRNKPVVFPIISTLFFFILPSMYIAVFGVNVAWWVYAVIAILLIYGGFAAISKVRKRISEGE